MAEQKESNEELVSNSANKPRVFISYARADASDFAEYLAAALKFAGFDAYLDRYNIAKAEDWEARLGDLIAKSDTIIFIITPQSVNSTRCDWEIKRTVAMSKRLVPVQWISVPEADVPVELKRLNYTIFTTGESFSAPLAELVDTLRQDLDWLRQQTQLNEQAGRWHGRERDPDLLLRGTEISEARAWLQHRKPSAPELAPVLKAYIGSSEEAEKARQSEENRQLIELRQKTKSYIEDAGDLTDSSIESAMVAFGNTLTAIKSGEDSSSLQERAKEVKTECDAFLKQRD